MRMVSSGNLETSYIVKSEDEIGQMGRTFNHMVVHIRELMHQVAEEEKQKRLIEIDFLQAQINPHFISNVLNNVVWMAKIQHADNIVPVINSLNSLLQCVMHQEEDLIPLQNELDYVDNYLRIIEYSGSYDFFVKKDIAEDTKNLYLLRFILQPILENAIYHGLPNDLSRTGCIKIQAKRQNGLLLITIEDNGNGMTQEEIKEVISGNLKDRKSFNGIGIANVNERIRLFFGEEYGLNYESQVGEYTKAVFKLPIIEDIGKELITCQKSN
jgi:sensor histidine kinase YesM